MEAEESREIHDISERFFRKRLKMVKAKALNTSIPVNSFIPWNSLLLLCWAAMWSCPKKSHLANSPGFIAATGFMVITAVKKLARAMRACRSLCRV